jgi:hypothetical protein
VSARTDDEVPDWTGLTGIGTARRYQLMAERELRGLSASYERLCLGVAGDPTVLARLDELPVPKRQPNLLLGAVRYLGGPIDTYSAFRGWLLAQWPQVSATMLARRTQTNEPGRCATLLPVLAALPQPLALLEVGASGGLCLYPDRYGYRYTGDGPQRRFGPPDVEFPCAVTGPAPLPAELPTVVWRAGLDLSPVDVTDDEDVRWLEALIWPEQTERLARLRAAVRIARADPPRIVAGDLLRDLPALAADAPDDATLVVFHSAVLAYVDAGGRAEFAATIRELAEQRPLCWVSNEAPGVVVDVDLPRPSRFVLARDAVPLALTGPHGQSLDWIQP